MRIRGISGARDACVGLRDGAVSPTRTSGRSTIGSDAETRGRGRHIEYKSEIPRARETLPRVSPRDESRRAGRDNARFGRYSAFRSARRRTDEPVPTTRSGSIARTRTGDTVVVLGTTLERPRTSGRRSDRLPWERERNGVPCIRCIRNATISCRVSARAPPPIAARLPPITARRRDTREPLANFRI